MTGSEKFCVAFAVVLAIACGVLGTMTHSARGDNANLTEKAAKAEADARTAIGARYRAEDSVKALMDAAEVGRERALYEQEKKLREELVCKP